MSKKFQTSIGVGYLRSGWDKSAVLREILSNANDAHVMHDAEMVVTHHGKTLTVVTRGATLERRNMLLGGGDKFGRADTIGQFEEGLKLALLVAAREGIPVKIRTGNEIWKPTIEPSKAFGGEEVLTICVTEAKEHFDGVEVTVGQISAAEWETEKAKYLFLLSDDVLGRSKPSEYANTDVLLHESQKGRVYVKGVFVQKMDDLAYGYDLRSGKVDRDRKMVNTWDAQYEMSQALLHLAGTNKPVAKTLYVQAKNARSDGAGYSLSYATGDALDALVESFDEEYGLGAIPCANAQQVADLRDLGQRAAVVPDRLRDALEKSRGNATAKIAALKVRPVETVARETLTTHEVSNLDMAIEVLREAGYTFAVDVVKFASPKTMGLISLQTGMILVSYAILGSLRTVVATLIHEVAHRDSRAGDGTAEHTAAVEEIWEKVWAKSFGA